MREVLVSRRISSPLGLGDDEELATKIGPLSIAGLVSLVLRCFSQVITKSGPLSLMRRGSTVSEGISFVSDGGTAKGKLIDGPKALAVPVARTLTANSHRGRGVIKDGPVGR